MNKKFDIHTQEFDIAVSFPGKHRAYVKAVVEALMNTYKIEPNKIFYDDFYKPFLAIPSSDTTLQDIYRNRSKLIVTFLCEKYQEREWCGLEARAIRDLIKIRENDKIMLVRMDDGEVEGFFGIDGWIDAKKYEPAEMAGFIYQRLTGEPVFPVSADTDETTSKTPTLPKNNLPNRNEHFTGINETRDSSNIYTNEVDDKMDKRDFFISYNKADKELAKWVAGTLEKADYSCYVQAWDMRPGDDFISKMNKFLEYSSAFIPILSQEYIDSPYCEIECSAALNKRLKDSSYKFIAVRVADVEPPDLIKTIVYIDIIGIGDAMAEKRLLNAVDKDPIPRTRPAFQVNKIKKDKSALPTQKNNLPPQNPDFAGRETELNDIHTVLKNGGSVCVKQAIAGLGGVGKTQLALEYAYRFGHKYTDAIWWVNAEKSPKDDLLEFAEEYKLIPEGRDAALQLKDAEFIRRLNGWFDDHTAFLLIFDNVEAADSIKPYISRLKAGHVLITTRDRYIDLPNTKSVDLDVFSLKDARAFMRKQLPKRAIDKKQTLDELMELLGCLPLALEQAAAYIANDSANCDCRNYISLLEQHGLQVFENAAAKLNGYGEIVTTTWGISFTKLSEAAQQLLYLCAYMAPDNIPLDFFVRQAEALPVPLRNELSNELKATEVMLSLTKYSLAKRNREYLSMHRLVQKVTRDELEKANDTQWLAYCLNIAHAVFKYEFGDKKSMDAFEQNALHVLEIAGYAEKAFDDDEEAQEKIAWLYHEAGFGYDYSGKYREALLWYHKARKIREKILGKEHPDTATTYNNIAGVYDIQGDYSKALEWYQKALDISEKVQGKEHPSTATTYNNIALVYSRQGDYNKALEWYQKALKIFQLILGDAHPNTIIVKENMEITSKKISTADP